MKSVLKKLRPYRSWLDIYSAVPRDKSRILQIGAGREEKIGLTIDINEDLQPDILHDLNVLPWPLKGRKFDVVRLFSIIEHLDYPLKALEYIHEILDPGGLVIILTPHFSDAASFVDPTHKWHLSVQSFDYLVPGSKLFKDYGFYGKARYKIRRRHIDLAKFWALIPSLQWAVNRWPEFWETYLCYIIRGKGIYIELEKI